MYHYFLGVRTDRQKRFWNPRIKIHVGTQKNSAQSSKLGVKRPLDAQYYCAMLIAQYIDGSP